MLNMECLIWNASVLFASCIMTLNLYWVFQLLWTHNHICLIWFVRHHSVPLVQPLERENIESESIDFQEKWKIWSCVSFLYLIVLRPPLQKWSKMVILRPLWASMYVNSGMELNIELAGMTWSWWIPLP